MAERARRRRSFADDLKRTNLALFLLDIDSFEAYNDIYGHQAGDECLFSWRERFRRHCAPGDLGARYGGEEFVAVLARTPATDAAAIAEAVRARVEALATRT